MNDTIIELSTRMKRAMRPFALLLYYLVLEGDFQYVLETGVNAAQSSRAILSAMEEKGSGQLISIDLKDRTERVPENLRKYWQMIVGDSTKKEIIESVGGIKYDMFLCDGGHYKPVPELDFYNYGRLVKKNGFILLHDVLNKNSDVPELWKKLQKEYENTITFPFGEIAGMGMIQKIR